jgi:hypothetical protein
MPKQELVDDEIANKGFDIVFVVVLFFQIVHSHTREFIMRACERKEMCFVVCG